MSRPSWSIGPYSPLRRTTVGQSCPLTLQSTRILLRLPRSAQDVHYPGMVPALVGGFNGGAESLIEPIFRDGVVPFVELGGHDLGFQLAEVGRQDGLGSYLAKLLKVVTQFAIGVIILVQIPGI